MYFLNINKPKGISSFDVVKHLRKRLNIKQIGHSGTLDPMAQGVLQVAIGGACKLLEYLKSDKTYIAGLTFGYVTDTFDIEGEKKFIKNPDFTKKDLIDVLNSFLGKSSQIPPKYSAIKLNGKRACDIIRKNPNIDLTLKKRQIEIYSIELLEFCNTNYKAKIKVCVKKGTYIRSLVNDIGQKLGCGAYMDSLIRTQAGDFKIENSNNLDDEILNKINPIDAVNLPKKNLNDEEYKRILNGNSIYKSKNDANDKILLTKDNKLVSIGYLADNLIKPKKVFRSEL